MKGHAKTLSSKKAQHRLTVSWPRGGVILTPEFKKWIIFSYVDFFVLWFSVAEFLSFLSQLRRNLKKIINCAMKKCITFIIWIICRVQTLLLNLHKFFIIFSVLRLLRVFGLVHLLSLVKMLSFAIFSTIKHTPIMCKTFRSKR